MRIKLILMTLLAVLGAGYYFWKFSDSELAFNSIVITEPVTESKSKIVDIQSEITIIAFFQTWCIDCIKEIPTLMALQKSIANSRLKIILITDESPEKVIAFKSKFSSFNIPIYISNTSLSSIGVKRYPTTIMISKSGRILLKTIEGKDWDSQERIDLVQKVLLHN